jgi:hypothetical protein
VTRTVQYHCLNCLDSTVTRDYDVSHLSRTCDDCGEFGRFLNEAVLEKFRAFEDSPPADFAWERLDRMEKYLVAERVVRGGHVIDDFSVEVADEE